MIYYLSKRKYTISQASSIFHTTPTYPFINGIQILLQGLESKSADMGHNLHSSSALHRTKTKVTYNLASKKVGTLCKN